MLGVVRGGGLAPSLGAVLVVKTTALGLGCWLLLMFFDPIAVVLGSLTVLGALVSHGAVIHRSFASTGEA